MSFTGKGCCYGVLGGARIKLFPLAVVGVGARANSFRKGRGSLRGSRGSFHGNRASSFRGSTRGRKGSMRGSFRVPKQAPGGAPAAAPAVAAVTAPPVRSSSQIMKPPKVETKIDISLFYQIFPEEILGSGQFGTVYGGECAREGKILFSEWKKPLNAGMRDGGDGKVAHMHSLPTWKC